MGGVVTGGIALANATENESRHKERVNLLLTNGGIVGTPGDYHFTDARIKEENSAKLAQFKEDAERSQTAAVAGFVGAAAMLGVAGFFFWLGREDQETTQISVQPNLHGGTIYLGAAF